MSSVVVGGLPIRVAPGSIKTDRDDGVDRARRFDQSYSASKTGGTARDFHFTTPPVSATDFAAYMAVLSQTQAQTCSGDIISIPTMCCAETHGWAPVRSQGATYYTIDFTLHESQSDKVLLKYSPGDTITGESFTRSTAAYEIEPLTIVGIPVSKAINIKRDSHYPTGVRSLLLEDTDTNPLVAPTDFNNAAWVKTTMTVGTGIADPPGGINAQTLTATAGLAQAAQVLSVGSSIVRGDSLWIKRRTGTGVISLLRPDNSGWTAVAVTSNWTRFTVLGAASTARASGVQITTNGDAVDVWQGQIDNHAFSTSENTSRGADLYSIPYTIPPGESTFYLKFVELGTVKTVNAPLFTISNAAGATPSVSVYAPAGLYLMTHNPSTGVLSTLPNAPAVGDTVEIVARLFGDGSVDITQSINDGAATSGTQSAALALATAWSGQLLWLNSFGTAALPRGYTALQSFKIVAGARSLSEMRAL